MGQRRASTQRTLCVALIALLILLPLSYVLYELITYLTRQSHPPLISDDAELSGDKLEEIDNLSKEAEPLPSSTTRFKFDRTTGNWEKIETTTQLIRVKSFSSSSTTTTTTSAPAKILRGQQPARIKDEKMTTTTTTTTAHPHHVIHVHHKYQETMPKVESSTLRIENQTPIHRTATTWRIRAQTQQRVRVKDPLNELLPHQWESPEKVTPKTPPTTTTTTTTTTTSPRPQWPTRPTYVHAPHQHHQHQPGHQPPQTTTTTTTLATTTHRHHAHGYSGHPYPVDDRYRQRWGHQQHHQQQQQQQHQQQQQYHQQHQQQQQQQQQHQQQQQQHHQQQPHHQQQHHQQQQHHHQQQQQQQQQQPHHQQQHQNNQDRSVIHHPHQTPHERRPDDSFDDRQNVRHHPITTTTTQRANPFDERKNSIDDPFVFESHPLPDDDDLWGREKVANDLRFGDSRLNQRVENEAKRPQILTQPTRAPEWPILRIPNSEPIDDDDEELARIDEFDEPEPTTQPQTTTTLTPTTTPSTTTTTTTTRTTPEPPRRRIHTSAPHQEMYIGDITIVTALMDIGRGDWWEYRRPLEKYHEFMENLLSLRNNMVIFTDDKSYDFVVEYRKKMGVEEKTKVYQITLESLPLWRYHDFAKEIIGKEHNDTLKYRNGGWDPQMMQHPEAKSAEYDILVNSKTHFLHNVTSDNPFGTGFFVWIDAGYGHGNADVFPFDGVWRPTFPKGKISMIKLTPVHDLISSYKIDRLYRQNWSVVSGGFIAGDAHTIGQLHTLFYRKFVELVQREYIDDDQTTMVLVINGNPDLFNIVHGDWFDAFRKFDPIFSRRRRRRRRLAQ